MPPFTRWKSFLTRRKLKASVPKIAEIPLRRTLEIIFDGAKCLQTNFLELFSTGQKMARTSKLLKFFEVDFWLNFEMLLTFSRPTFYPPSKVVFRDPE